MHRRESLGAMFTFPFAAHAGWRSSTRQLDVPTEWVNVKATGASGTGQSDDSRAIQRALEKVSAGGTVYVPPGRYRIDSPVSPRFLGRYQHGVQVRLRLDPGAILVGASADRSSAVVDCRESPGQDGSFLIDGGIIEGMVDRAGTGVRVATQNVAMDGTLVRGFGNAGVDFGSDGAAPAIRTSLHRVALLFNRVGLSCAAQASGLVIDKCWIEGSAEEGVVIHGAGHVSIVASIIEGSGVERKSAAQLAVRGLGATSVNVISSYFESLRDQAHAQVVVDGAETSVKNFLFTGNLVGGYQVDGAVGVSIGSLGAVDTTTITANTFVGSRLGVSIGRYTHDYLVSGNSWSDSFAQAVNLRVQIDGRRRDVVRMSGIADVHESSRQHRIRRVSSDTPVATDDRTLLCDASARSLTISLGSAVAAENVLVVKKIDASTHPVRIVPVTGELVEGSTILSLNGPRSSVSLQSDGTSWWSIGAT